MPLSAAILRRRIRSPFGQQSGGVTYAFHGDSITGAVGAPSVEYGFPARLATLLGSVSTEVFGISGQGWDYIWPSSGWPDNLTDDAVARIDPLIRASSHLVLFAGTNDIALGGSSGAATAAFFDTYINARIAAGWDMSQTVVCTMLPRNTTNVARAAYNSDLVTKAATYNYLLARLDEITGMGGDGENTGGYFDTDGIHPNGAGHQEIANCIYKAIVGSDPIIALTWDPAKKAANASLSGANLVASGPAGSSWQTVLGTAGYSTGKRYFEVRVSALSTNENYIIHGVSGIPPSYNTANYLGSHGVQLGMQGESNLFRSNMTAGAGTGREDITAVGDTFGYAVDLDAGNIWVRKKDGTGWIGGGDPVAGTNPHTTFAANTKLWPAASFLVDATNALTIKSGSTLTYSVPSGFSSW